MRKLDQKLIRDLNQMKGQAVAIIAVIAAGIAVFTMSMCAYASLQQGKDAFYQNHRFADLFCVLNRCPNAMSGRLEAIPGVAQVDTRLVYHVRLEVPGMDEPAKARLISIPDRGQSILNQVYISRGRMIDPDQSGEAVVSEMFADAHGFQPGDSVEAILNGKRQTLTIVGIALSPEFVMQIEGGSLLPDKKRFGIFWMNQRQLESAFDMSGAFNNVSFRLDYGANPDRVIESVDRLLNRYGSDGAFGRQLQLSHQYVTDELMQLRTMATLAPAIFLSVAAFLLNLVVSRIISQQREQIAALKAFGYTNLEVGMHYLNLVMVIALVGMVLGVLFGIWMAENLTEMYQEFYRFPKLTLKISQAAILWALVLTAVATVLGTLLAVRQAMALPPAEAMRPEAPPTFQSTWIERLIPTRLMPAEVRMIVRNLERKPVKSGISVLGIGMAVAVLILGSFSLDALNYLIDFQFRKAQRQDLSVAFVEPATASVTQEVAKLTGVLDSEVIRGVSARIRFGHRHRRVGVTGLVPEPNLFRLLDSREQAVKIPTRGMMLNSKLAEILDVKLGDVVTMEVLEGRRPVMEVEVTAIVNEFGGTNAYMNKSYLHELLKESSVATGAFLKVDPAQIHQVYSQLERRPGVASVTLKDAAIESFRETIAENVLTMRSFNILFAVVIAIGVVYNHARISLSEQSRNLATMRVIGFSEREVATVLLGEIFIFTLLAIPLGWLLGYLLAALLILGLDTENYRIPLVINRGTYAFAASVVAIAALVSAMAVQRRINRLDLISALKTRE